ncbi:MAG TPA: hypothetical protein VFM49_30140 [Chloroflexia bacterium]|nr:hypothetical protein [Chloroflexia bacterium]
MNTQFSQYVNESRAAQHAQDLQREAAAERALRDERRVVEEASHPPAQHSERWGVGMLLTGLLRRHAPHAGR